MSKYFNLEVQQKVTIWCTNHFRIEADTEEEAKAKFLAVADKKDLPYDVDHSHTEWHYDSEVVNETSKSSILIEESDG